MPIGLTLGAHEDAQKGFVFNADTTDQEKYGDLPDPVYDPNRLQDKMRRAVAVAFQLISQQVKGEAVHPTSWVVAGELLAEAFYPDTPSVPYTMSPLAQVRRELVRRYEESGEDFPPVQR